LQSRAGVERAMRAAVLFLLRFYKRFTSAILPPMCRFEPSC